MGADDIGGNRKDLDIRSHVVYRLSLYTTIANRNGKAYFQDRFGITLTEYRILAVIGYAEPISLMGLVDECYLDKGQVSRVASKLEDEGFVRRVQDDDAGARGGKLRLTRKGRTLLKAALDYGDELNARSISVLTDQERRQFSKYLDRILAHARTLHDQTHKRSASDELPPAVDDHGLARDEAG
jgi:DNA-binding MarR family transcriptional regulator